jgi:hypothetical protein
VTTLAERPGAITKRLEAAALFRWIAAEIVTLVGAAEEAED